MTTQPVAQSPQGKPVTITQATVTINAVKVEGKAMTLALFDQLPIADEVGRWEHLPGTFSPPLYRFSHPASVELWGYVSRKHAVHKRLTYHTWLLLTHHGTLYRLPLSPYPPYHHETQREGQYDVSLLPQLFIAV